MPSGVPLTAACCIQTVLLETVLLAQGYPASYRRMMKMFVNV